MESTSLGITFYSAILSLNDPEERLLEESVGKEGNAGNQHFLPFPQCFLHPPRNSIFPATFNPAAAIDFCYHVQTIKTRLTWITFLCLHVAANTCL